MNDFIKLTAIEPELGPEGIPVPGDEESTIYVRASAIIGLVPNEGFTTVNVQGDGVLVAESPEDIMALIDAAGFRGNN
jgi:hypothetical protein